MGRKAVPKEQLEHGITRYRKGGRCEICKAANAAWRDHYRVTKSQRLPVELVDAEPARINVKKLKANGMPLEVVAERARVTPQTLYRLIYGHCGLPPTVQLEKEKAGRICLVAFDPLPKGKGANAIGARRRLQALHWRGWAWKRIEREAPIDSDSLVRILNGTQDVVRWEMHSQIAEFYAKFWLTDGGDKAAKRRARAQRFVPPGGWDVHTIDDWRAEPDPGVDWAA